MPILELPEESPIEGAVTLAFPILSAMLFPQEDEAMGRRQWRASAMAGSYSEWRRMGVQGPFLAEFHGWIADLWELPQAPRRIYQDGWARLKRASLSGGVLRFMLRLARHHPAHCKLERAKALVQDSFSGDWPSESLLNKSWADFKAASHLWAAFLDKHPKGKNEQWIELLARAEAIRREAEAARVLNPLETWKAPEAMNIADIEIEVPPLPPELLAFLDREFPL